jgi:hypothetical protein
VISPILANLYLHQVLDLWAHQWRRKKATGGVIIARYADDAVLGFQYRNEAERFLQELRERMGKFGLELHPEKTRLIEFGRYAADRRKQRGEGCPETCNFLGFTHICGTNRKTGYYTIIRQTISKRRAAKLKQINAELRQRMHDPLMETAKWLQSVVRVYFQYHAVPGNEKSLGQFRKHALGLWLRQIRRRSQRSRWTWERFLSGSSSFGAVATPVFACPDQSADGALADIVGGIQPGTIKKGEQVGPLMEQMLGEPTIELIPTGVGQHPI